MVDEAGDKWTEKQVLFLQSRLRTVGSKIHPQLILTCNPDPNSFLKEWVDFCLDPVTGVPVSGTENRIRWFYVEDNKARWADSPEECYELYGKPKNLIYAHRLSAEELNKFTQEEKTRLFMPKSFRFIPTNVFDNPFLLPPKNNSYLSSLQSQPYVNQLKYLHGSWTAREDGANYFKAEWCEVVPTPPVNPVARVRAWDFAASRKTVSFNPDFTAGVLMSRDRFGIYYIEDAIRLQDTTDGVLKKVVEVANYDGTDETTTCIPVDAAASGKIAADFYASTLADDGVFVKKIPMNPHKNKLTKFLPFAQHCENGFVKIVKGDWNKDFIEELQSFTGERSTSSRKDDQVDATSDAFLTLARQRKIPDFIIPDLAQPSVVPTIQ